MHRQSEPRAGNHPRHTRTRNVSIPTQANHTVRGARKQPPNWGATHAASEDTTHTHQTTRHRCAVLKSRTTRSVGLTNRIQCTSRLHANIPDSCIRQYPCSIAHWRLFQACVAGLAVMKSTACETQTCQRAWTDKAWWHAGSRRAGGDMGGVAGHRCRGAQARSSTGKTASEDYKHRQYAGNSRETGQEERSRTRRSQ